MRPQDALRRGIPRTQARLVIFGQGLTWVAPSAFQREQLASAVLGDSLTSSGFQITIAIDLMTPVSGPLFHIDGEKR